jgi:hypothetical protein
MLEAASLEEDSDLQALWAQLLASAAAHKSSYSSHPAFIQTLRQMSKEEAVFFSALYDRVETAFKEWIEMPLESRPRHSPLDRLGGFEELGDFFVEGNGKNGKQDEGVADESLEVMVGIDNVVRLGLIKPPFPGRTDYSLPAFGSLFAETCRGPSNQPKAK